MHVASAECIILTLGELGDVDSIVSNLIDDLTIYQTNPCFIFADECFYLIVNFVALLS